jgi:hypothetical protein
MILQDFISKNEMARRKELITNIIEYDLKDCDHIPIYVIHFPNTKNHSLTDVYHNDEIALEYELEKIKSTLQKVPDDYIPSFRSDLGYVVTQSVFGMKPIYSSEKGPAKYPDQAPYMDPKTKPIDSLEKMHQFKKPQDILEKGLVPKGLKRVSYFMQQTHFEIPTSCLDTGNGLLQVYELTETNLFFLTMKDDPAAIRHMNDIVTDVIIQIQEAVIKEAGGIEHMTSTEWEEKWLPEGKKCYISSEMQPLYSAKDYPAFDLPYCNRQFERFGPGFLHNCGPQSALDFFWDHHPKPYGLTCEYYSSIHDYDRIKEKFAAHHKAVLFVEFTNMKTIEEMVAAYQDLMERLAPDVIAIPWLWAGPVHICQEEPEKIYQGLLPISKEYINRVKHGHGPEKHQR